VKITIENRRGRATAAQTEADAEESEGDAREEHRRAAQLCGFDYDRR
jgi:hypothetical protein